MSLCFLNSFVLFSVLYLVNAKPRRVNLGSTLDMANLAELVHDTQYRNALRSGDERKWKMNPTTRFYEVPFQVLTNNGYTSEEISNIKKAILAIHANSCVRFVTTRSRDFIDISNGGDSTGCFSSVGRQTGKNTVNLESSRSSTCMDYDIVLHELLHALGLWHEHMRPDRDSYIKVLWQNLPNSEEYRDQFETCTDCTTYSQPYDYNSIMHYDMHAFAKTDYLDSMEAINSDGSLNQVASNLMGHATEASKADWAKINEMYPCDQAPASLPDTNIVDQACSVGPWTLWSSCSTSCGDGSQSRLRVVVREPNSGSDPCPLSGETQKCNSGSCPQTGCVDKSPNCIHYTKYCYYNLYNFGYSDQQNLKIIWSYCKKTCNKCDSPYLSDRIRDLAEEGIEDADEEEEEDESDVENVMEEFDEFTPIDDPNVDDVDETETPIDPKQAKKLAKETKKALKKLAKEAKKEAKRQTKAEKKADKRQKKLDKKTKKEQKKTKIAEKANDIGVRFGRKKNNQKWNIIKYNV